MYGMLPNGTGISCYAILCFNLFGTVFKKPIIPGIEKLHGRVNNTGI